MSSRLEILKKLILLRGNIEVLKNELSIYPWDVENPLLTIKADDLSSVLKRSINNEIDFNTLTNWANVIECRDDLEFETEEMQEIIFELANPEINGEITNERLQALLYKLNG